MNRTVNLDAAGIQVIMDGLSKPIRNAASFFSVLANLVDQDTQMVFDRQGAAGGPRAVPAEFQWPPFKPSTLRYPSGTFKIRYGTDMKGKGPRGVYQPNARRYSFNSKLLQASGQFRQSFHVMQHNATGMRYGTDHRLKGAIGSRPRREVLFFANGDMIRWGRMFQNFIDQGIQF